MSTEHYHKAMESAGRLMTSRVPTIHGTATVSEVEQLLLCEGKNFETINYIYILNEDKHLKGVLSIKEIFRSQKSTPIRKLMTKRVISVRVHTDQERVALLALQHNLKAMPVIDKDDVFLGVITSDTILHILNNEAIEDILRLGGVLHRGSIDDIFHLPILTSLKHRLPWLIIGLCGGIVVAGIVSSFEEVLSKNFILAAFIPLIVYMADAVGAQMSVFMIRDLAVSVRLQFFRYFMRQALLTGIMGVIISIVLYTMSTLLYHNPQVSLVLGIALFCAIISSLVTGLVVPYIFDRFRLDPANASGPIATIIQDGLSVIIYFAIASLIL